MVQEENERGLKPLEEMDVIDDFLFTEIVSDEEDGTVLCRMILECVLGREIGKISFTPQRTVPGVTERSHGIRMDAYVTEKKPDAGENEPEINVYDVEPDKSSSHREGLRTRCTMRYAAEL